MERRMLVFSAGMCILLLIAGGGAAMAQTGTAPVLSGYYVNINRQPSGPFDTSGLRQLISNGQLTIDTLVWKEGMPEWTVAGKVAELAPLFPSAPPPLPPQESSSPPPLPSEPPPLPAVQPASQAVQGAPWGGHPVAAGFVNTIFGIWSFTNQDFPGGIATAALETGGIVLSVIGSSLYRTWYNAGSSTTLALVMYYGGYGVLVGGSIYGFVRGYTQYNAKMAAARSFAEAINQNPLNNISLTALPTPDGKHVTGALVYSLSY